MSAGARRGMTMWTWLKPAVRDCGSPSRSQPPIAGCQGAMWETSHAPDHPRDICSLSPVLREDVSSSPNIIQKRLPFPSSQNISPCLHRSIDICLSPETLLNSIELSLQNKQPYLWLGILLNSNYLDTRTPVCWFKSLQTFPEPEVIYLYKMNCLWK